MASPTEDQVFIYTSLWGTFLIQTPSGPKPGTFMVPFYPIMRLIAHPLSLSSQPGVYEDPAALTSPFHSSRAQFCVLRVSRSPSHWLTRADSGKWETSWGLCVAPSPALWLSYSVVSFQSPRDKRFSSKHQMLDFFLRIKCRKLSVYFSMGGCLNHIESLMEKHFVKCSIDLRGYYY